jgi:hypothetical protein
MDIATKRLVRSRARDRCEYCLLPQVAQPFITFRVEHVIPKTHGGSEELTNLCLACERCNAFKGPNLTGIDPATGQVERLFNPRSQDWKDHFELRHSIILGLTSVGGTTAETLKFNAPRRVQLRSNLSISGED